MRVALFGGSFDPPHRGHVVLARLARERLALDRVLVAPVGTQPLKQERTIASFTDRLAMTRLAFENEPGVEISLVDGPRPDGSFNYTIDTLSELRRRLDPEDALFCIVGADSFLTIGTWHRSAELLTMCDFIVGARPGFDLSRAQAALPGGLQARVLPTSIPHTQVMELEGNGRCSRVYLMMDLAEEVSASEIRSALRGEAESGGVLARPVEQYIRIHELYTHL